MGFVVLQARSLENLGRMLETSGYVRYGGRFLGVSVLLSWIRWDGGVSGKKSFNDRDGWTASLAIQAYGMPFQAFFLSVCTTTFNWPAVCRGDPIITYSRKVSVRCGKIRSISLAVAG